MALNTEILSRAATEARGLAMDAVQAAASGHLGLPLGAAEVGAVLFGHALRYLPEDPAWINRDRTLSVHISRVAATRHGETLFQQS